MKYDMWNGYCNIYVKDSAVSGTGLSGTGYELMSYRTGGVGYATNLKPPYLKIGAYYALWDIETYPTRLTVNSDNAEVRQWTGRHDALRFYLGNLSMVNGIAAVRPR
jgi:hypothetical protein